MAQPERGRHGSAATSQGTGAETALLAALGESADLEIDEPTSGPIRDRSSSSVDGSPVAVIRALNRNGVAYALRTASAFGTPVATRGAGSGLAGGAAAGSGWIVLDMSRLDRIVEIDAVDQIAVVEPGVSAAELDSAAAAHGLQYAPDPASVEISSIGGNIATNAGGFHAVKYGVTRDAIRALTVVTGDGRTLRTGAPTTKGVVGFDLVSLITGSEGTLAVVVEAAVALQPIPRDTVTLAAYFPSINAAAEAAVALLGSDVTPSLCELLDAATLRAIDAATGTDYSLRGNAFLLVQADGWGSQAEAARIAELLGPFASEIHRTADPAEADLLIRTRRLALPSIERLGRLLIEDIAVPVSRLAHVVERIEEIAARTGTRIFTMGHAGDGNLHPIILVPEDDDPERRAHLAASAQVAADEIFALALEFGGTVSAEHGVGSVKRAWGRKELGDVAVELHEGIKRVFDPAGILNPGRGF